jgi:hypothetical protein
MSVEQALAILGIAFTVILGVVALIVAKVVKSRRQWQRQSVGRDGIGVQSGRDTTIGRK